MASILYQFKESLKFLSNLELISSKNIPNLFVKKEFGKFIEEHFDRLTEDKLFEKVNDLLSNNANLYPQFKEQLKMFLKCIIEAVRKYVNPDEAREYADRYSNKMETIQQSTDIKEQLNDMHCLLKEMFGNLNSRRLIKDALWNEYFDTQKTIDLTSSKKIKESTDGYFYQMQADPLKRAFYLAFTALFNYINHEIYLASEGEEKIDYGIEDSSETQVENPVATYYRRTKGVAFP